MKNLPRELWIIIFNFFSDEELLIQSGNIAVSCKIFRRGVEQYLIDKLKKDFEVTHTTNNPRIEYIKYYRGYTIIENFILNKFPQLQLQEFETMTLHPLSQLEPTQPNPISSLYKNLHKLKEIYPIANKPFILTYIFEYALYTPSIRYARNGKLFNSLLTKVLKVINNTVIFKKNVYGKNALHYATFFGNHQATFALLEKTTNKIAVCFEGDRDNKTPLTYSASSGNLETFSTVFNCFDKKTELCSQKISNDGTLLLHHAIVGKSIDIVRLVLSFIVNKETACFTTDNFYANSFSKAAASGNAAIIKELLQFISDKEKACLECFFYAAGSGSAEAIQVMLKYVQNKEAACLKRGTFGKTPLHYAAKSGSAGAINKILEHITDKKTICQENALIGSSMATTKFFGSVIGCAWESGNTDAVKAVLFYFDDKPSIWKRLRKVSLGNCKSINQKEIELYVNSPSI